MKYGKTMLYAGLAGLVIGFYTSMTTMFLVLMLGLLFVPPVVVIMSTIIEGISVLMKEYHWSLVRNSNVIILK